MTLLQGAKTKRHSKTIWGGAIATGAGLAGFAAPFVAWISSGQAPADLTSLVQAVTSIAASIAGIVAIVGRITATKRIG